MKLRKAMILCAGFGTRMGELSRYYPKPLLPILGLPIVEYLLRSLAIQGIEEVVINLHHHGMRIADEIGDGRRLGLDIHYLYEEVIRGTGGGVQNARSFLDDEPFLLVNGDIVFRLDLAELYAQHLALGATATLVLRTDRELDNYGAIYLDERQKIVGMLDQGRKTESRYMFTGIHLLDPAIFDYLPSDLPGCIVKNCYLISFQDTLAMSGYVMNEADWSDLGSLPRYHHENIRLIALPKYHIPPIDGWFVQAQQSIIKPEEIRDNDKIKNSVIGNISETMSVKARIERAIVFDGVTTIDRDLIDCIHTPFCTIDMSRFDSSKRLLSIKYNITI